MLNHRISSFCDFGNSISVAVTADHAGRQRETLDRVAGIERQHHRHHHPAAEQHECRRQQARQPAHVVAHREADRQHRDAAEGRIGRQLVAGGDVADLHIAEIVERPQRHPRQQQRPDEGGAADDIHHLLAPQSADDRLDLPAW